MELSKERITELSALPDLSVQILESDPLITSCCWDSTKVTSLFSNNTDNTDNTDNVLRALGSASTSLFIRKCAANDLGEYAQKGTAVPHLDLRKQKAQKYDAFPLGCEEVSRFDRTMVRVLNAPIADALRIVSAAHTDAEVAYLWAGRHDAPPQPSHNDTPEDAVIRHTTLSFSLSEDLYPLEPFQAVLTKNVRLIRGSHADGYPFLKSPPRVSAVGIPSILRPAPQQLQPQMLPPPQIHPPPHPPSSSSSSSSSQPSSSSSQSSHAQENGSNPGDDENDEDKRETKEKAFNAFYLELRAKLEMQFAVCAKEVMDVLVVGPLPCYADKHISHAYAAEAIKSVISEFAGFFSFVYVIPPATPQAAAQAFANAIVGTNNRAPAGSAEVDVKAPPAQLLPGSSSSSHKKFKEYGASFPWLIRDRAVNEREICPYGGKCHGYDEFHGVEFWHPPHCPRGPKCELGNAHKLLFTHDERTWTQVVEAESFLMRGRAWREAPVPRSLEGLILPLPSLGKDMTLHACHNRIAMYQDAERDQVRGRVRVDRCVMDTALQIHKIDLKYLRYWCQAAGFELLYRSAPGDEGFSSDEFHRRCDGAAPTLILVYDGMGVFGGYTEAPWDQTPPEPSGREFIFTLKSSNNVPVRFSLSPTHTAAVSHTQGFGPGFGAGEIRIPLREENHMGVGYGCGNYVLPSGAAIAPTGRRFFTLHTIEVFRVVQDDDEFEALKASKPIAESDALFYAEYSPPLECADDELGDDDDNAFILEDDENDESRRDEGSETQSEHGQEKEQKGGKKAARDYSGTLRHVYEMKNTLSSMMDFLKSELPKNPFSSFYHSSWSRTSSSSSSSSSSLSSSTTSPSSSSSSLTNHPSSSSSSLTGKAP